MKSKDMWFAKEGEHGVRKELLPEHAPMLAAYYRAHADVLRASIASLALFPGDRVLDVACGDGTSSIFLAEHIGLGGAVTGIDSAPAFLTEARSRANNSGWGKIISLREGRSDALPFDDNSFDMVWCAHHLSNNDDLYATLRELRRVARPGGYVAAFEAESIVLPWPDSVKNILAIVEHKAADDPAPAFGVSSSDFCAVFNEAGLAACTVETFTTTRRSSLSADERTYLAYYIDELRHYVQPYLVADHQQFDRVTDPASNEYLLNTPDFVVTYIDTLVCGRKLP